MEFYIVQYRGVDAIQCIVMATTAY